MKQTEETKENQKKLKEENEEVEKEIFFGQFEDDPANYVEIEKKLRANHEILSYLQEYNAKIKIQKDKIAYLVP